MGCCEQKNQSKTNGDDKTQKHNCSSGFKHMLLMIACCLAPVGVALLLKVSGYEGAANYLVFLLCPLMHLFMMKGMLHKKQETEPSDIGKL